jgi:hypothetical protein
MHVCMCVCIYIYIYIHIYVYIYILHTHTVRAGRLNARMEAKKPASVASCSVTPSDLRTGTVTNHVYISYIS